MMFRLVNLTAHRTAALGAALALAAFASAAPPAKEEPPKRGFLRSVLAGKEGEPARLLAPAKLDEKFYTWIKKSGVYSDPDDVFTLKNGVLRVSGKHQGYLATKAQFGDCRIVVEYKWGAAKWPPRENKPRNSGVFISATGEDKEWMKGLECQIAEGTTGGVVLHGGAQLKVGGELKTRPWMEFPPAALENPEKPNGEWNTMEIISEGPHLKIRVNGHTTLEGFEATPYAGRILLQSNGAEIFFRRLDVYPLSPGQNFSGGK